MSESALIIALFSVLITLFVVLFERKFLAYAQRRMGPSVMGRNGLFQIVLDLVKLVTKEVFLIPRTTSLLAPIISINCARFAMIGLISAILQWKRPNER